MIRLKTFFVPISTCDHDQKYKFNYTFRLANRNIFMSLRSVDPLM